MQRAGKGFLEEQCHWWVLLAFAVTQPVFDLLSRSPEFFIARRSPPSDIVTLVLGLSLLVPSSVSLILWTLAQLSRPAYVLCHRILIGGLGATLVLLASREVSSLSGSALVIGAVVISAGATGMYHRFPFVRLFLTFLTPALLVFPVVFLFF